MGKGLPPPASLERYARVVAERIRACPSSVPLRRPLSSLPFPGFPSPFTHQLQRSKSSSQISKMSSSAAGALPLASLNHISIVCRSVEASLDFYQNVLGFFPIRRPGSFDFDGAWLFNYGIGVHLLQSEAPEKMPRKREINPKDNPKESQRIIQENEAFVLVPSKNK